MKKEYEGSVQYIANMNFPNDKAWVEVNKFIEKFNCRKSTVIAPVEFCAISDIYKPLHWSYWEAVSESEFVIVHKGKIDDYHEGFLSKVFSEYSYAYGNSVFIIFVKDKEIVDGVEGDETHFSIKDVIYKIINKRVVKHYESTSLDIDSNGKIKRILIVSANRFGNLGDDAITHSAYQQVIKAFPDAEVVIDNPPSTKQYVLSFDMVVLGGGGIFYDACFYNATNYMQYLLWADEAGIPSCSIGIGTQGIKTLLGKSLYKNTLDKSKLTIVRDKRDYEVLVHEVGVQSKVVLLQDIVFALQNTVALDSRFEFKKSNGKPVLLYSLLDSSKMLAAKKMLRYQNTATECIEMLLESFDVKYLIQSRDDLKSYRENIEKYNLEVIEISYENAPMALEIYKKASLVLTSRFHGYIFSLRAGVPVIGVGSSGSKIQRLVKNSIPSAKNTVIPLSKFTMEALKEKIDFFKQNPKVLMPNSLEIEIAEQQALLTSAVVSESFQKDI